MTRDKTIPDPLFRTYHVLSSFGRERIFPAHQTLADIFDVDRRTVIRRLAALKEMRLITWVPRGGTSNMYYMLRYEDYLTWRDHKEEPWREIVRVLEEEENKAPPLQTSPPPEPAARTAKAPKPRRSSEPLAQAQAWFSQAMSELKLQMTSAAFTQWLAGAELHSYDGKTMCVHVSTKYAVDWLTNRWKTMIERLLRGVSRVPDLEVEFVAE